MIPAERGYVLQEIVGGKMTARSQVLNSAPEIDRIPIDDRRGNEIEAGSSIALVLRRPIDDPALLMEENGLNEGVA
jgi:hypothetical protein